MNKRHQRRFELVMTKINTDNLPLLSAVYLLTADRKLWIQAQRHIGKNRINFDQIKPFDCSEYGYPLYCAAKDVYLNTKHFTLLNNYETEKYAQGIRQFCLKPNPARKAIPYTPRRESKATISFLI